MKTLLIFACLTLSSNYLFASADDHNEPAKPEEKKEEAHVDPNAPKKITKKEAKIACKDEGKRGKALMDCINEKLEK